MQNLTYSSPRVLLITASLAFALTAQSQTSPAPNEQIIEPDDIITLSPFEVKVEADDGYKVANAVSGTRFNTNLLDLPKAVDVVSSEFMKDIGALDMVDALQYVPGITADVNPGGDDIFGGTFSVRGFSSGTSYRNGFPSSFVVDPIMLDRVEIIKGPSSVFSGPIEPGGTRNYITRKPPAKQTTSLTTRYESFERYRADIVNGGPLNHSKSLSYRVAGVVENGRSYQDFADRERYVAAGTVLWKISPKATWQNDVQFVKNNITPSADIPYFNQSTAGGVTTYWIEPNVPRSFNRNGPHSKSHLAQLSAISDFTYELSKTWSLRAGLMYTFQDLNRLLIGGSTRVFGTGANRYVQRATAEAQPDAVSYVLSPQVYALGNFKYHGVEHKLILGGEFYYNDQKNDIYQRAPNLLSNAFIERGVNNDYTIGTWSEYNPVNFRRVLNRYSGTSMNNVFTLLKGRVTAMQSLRYSTINTINKNILNGSRAQTDQDNWVQSYGASVRMLPKLSAFVSYGESFIPQTVFTFAGEVLEPIEGSGWDYGIKFDMIEGRLSGSIVAYDIDRENAALADPIHSGYFLASGVTTSQGLEVSIQARPVNAWQITAGYSYIDAKVVTGLNATRLGRVSNIPQDQYTLWNHYKFKRSFLKGIGAGAGLVYVGNRRGNPTLPDQVGISLPSYTRINASLTYETKFRKSLPVIFRIEANNLTDEEYLVTYTGYGMPRTWAGSVTFRF